MLIGCDIDGVLFPWADVANEVLQRQFGIPDPGPHVEWLHLKNTITPEQWAWLWSVDGQDYTFCQVQRNYPDAVGAVRRLIELGHEVHFVTHRDPALTTLHTACFLKAHFKGLSWGGVHIVHAGSEKRMLAPWDVFIDDKPETVQDFIDFTPARVFMPVRPWNEYLVGREFFGSEQLHTYTDATDIVDYLTEVKA